MYSIGVQVLVKLMRRNGVRVAAAALKATDWTECELLSASRSANGRSSRCLVLRGLMQIPSTDDAMAELFQPTVADVGLDELIIRGVERIDVGEGRVAAVVQEWCVKQRPYLGPQGLQSPLANDIRQSLPGASPFG
jgi:hypothetical protein